MAQDSKAESAKALFQKMVGKWEGNCKTWFEPGKLADESTITGEFESIFDGKFVRFRYEGSIKGKKRTGEAMLAFNPITDQYQESWIDSFHMNYAIMYSQGQPSERGFEVSGEYDTGKGQPRWRWRTEYELVKDDELVVTAYNISPEGQEAKAIETTFKRVK